MRINVSHRRRHRVLKYIMVDKALAVEQLNRILAVTKVPKIEEYN